MIKIAIDTFDCFNRNHCKYVSKFQYQESRIYTVRLSYNVVNVSDEFQEIF